MQNEYAVSRKEAHKAVYAAIDKRMQIQLKMIAAQELHGRLQVELDEQSKIIEILSKILGDKNEQM